MEQDVTSIIQQRIAELPPDVRNAVQAADLSAKIHDVGQKHSLHIDQLGNLEDEVLLTMLGFVPLASFGARLATELRLPPAAGEALAGDISTIVFGPIRESMKNFLAERQQAMAPAPSAPAAPAAAAVPAPQPVPLPPPPAAAPQAPDPLHKADVMLTQKTVDVPAPKPPAAPQAQQTPPAMPLYKADPYREPL